MNFSYLEREEDFFALYAACREAEEFALTKPDISAASARKAMESIVRYIYAGIDAHPPYGCTVYDMINDSRFRGQFADPAMLDSIDYIRKMGNTAVHQGSLTVEDAVRVLQHLHFLAGEFAIGMGLIVDYPLFEIPKLNPIREVMARIHSDNFELSVAPYLFAEGHADWAEMLENCGITSISKLYELPETLVCDGFFEFLKQFENSIADEVAQLVELLPLSYATEDVWEQRRKAVPRKAIERIECYVSACRMNQKNTCKRRWTEYSRVLGAKAPGYVWLVHPEVLPHSIREGLVQEKSISGESSEEAYISLDDALQQIIRRIAEENKDRYRRLASEPWCKAMLGLPVAMLRPSGHSRDARFDTDSLYCKKSVHFGDRRYIYYVAWSRAQLMKLRSYAGKIGEELITMDSLADWGFVTPGSEAEKRALERAERRRSREKTADELRRARESNEAAEDSAAKGKKAEEDPEASPRAIRIFLEEKLNMGACLEDLCSEMWNRQNMNFTHPVLIPYEEGIYLRRKQMDGRYTYSPLQLEYCRKSYFIHRMKISEFERLKKILS